MKHYKFISSVISLILSSCLLAATSYAWFTSNTIVDSAGIEGVVTTNTISEAKLKKFIAVESNNKYTNGELITNSSLINPYDLIALYDRIIYQFEITSSEDLTINLSMKLTDSNRSNLVTFNATTSKYKNYLSNVSNFTLINNDNSLANLSYAFLYNDSSVNEIIIYNAKITKGVNVVRFLLDYDGNNINQLYTDNLGVNGNITFENDIKFYIEEA